MRFLQSIFIFSILFFASAHCTAGNMDFPFFEMHTSNSCAEKTGLDDSYDQINLIHFFQRTEQLNVHYSSGKDFQGELFFRFGMMENTSEKLVPAFQYCTPIGIILIFPKHYFF